MLCGVADIFEIWFSASQMQSKETTKSKTIPPLRVTAAMKKKAESVLQEGETLSQFMMESLTRNIDYRKSHEEFLVRGLASAALAQKTGKYVSEAVVMKKLEKILADAKRRRLKET
jgi:TnpA family transposase